MADRNETPTADDTEYNNIPTDNPKGSGWLRNTITQRITETVEDIRDLHDTPVAGKDRASTIGTLTKGFGGSRRNFLQACTLTGLGAFGLQMTSTVAGATCIKEECNQGRLDINDYFQLIDNQWGNPDASQCVWINEDGTYGWDFDASNTESGINYPEVFIGTRPWGSDTGVSEFPIRRRDISEFVLDVQVESSISDGEWDFAQEWWLMEEPPSVQTRTYQYEVMLLLDWGGGHDHGSPLYTDLWTDKYGNTIDLWTIYDSGGTSAKFYIFRVQGGHDGGKIDAKRITDWLTQHEGVSEDLWLSGSELGNEYWPPAAGQTTFTEFGVTINGCTYTSTGSAETADRTAPPAPTTLSSPSHGENTVELTWDSVTDSGGSGLAEYVVYTDGTENHRVDAGTTSTTVSGLAVETTTQFSVTAIDGAGNESATSNTIAVTTDRPPEPADIQSGGTYKLENKNSGLVLDVGGDTDTNGATIVQEPWADTETKQWVVRDNGDGSYRLVNKESGKVADVEAWATSDGADIHQWEWVEGRNQRWTLLDNGDGTVRLQNRHSELALEVADDSTSAGANVQQGHWTGDDTQRWHFTLLDTTALSVPTGLASPTNDDSSAEIEWEASTDSGESGLAQYIVYVDGTEDHRVAADTTSTTVTDIPSETTVALTVTAIDAEGNESAASEPITVTTDSKSESSEIQSGTTYRIENKNSTLVLDVASESASNGVTIVQESWTGADTQQWVARDNGDGTYRLENRGSGKVVDVESWSANQGGDVHQWSYVGGANQRWIPIRNDDGTYRFENKHSGLVLDVRWASTETGANVQQWAWNGGDGQRWQLVPVES
ncbi:RICIN domain-containing protein [Halohasta salina]|uniref:RICIN domain-containing protein n=1 Tax=Halohasta salina TaxID=2961621 RepID=UPI0020A4298A|nr:RICIN domain-containing protein [Halohasta salina]